MEEEEELFDETDEELNKAATKIQSVYRGYSYRREQSLKETHQYKAKLIQRTWRAYVDRCKLKRVTEILALFRINRVVRHYSLRISARKTKFRLQQFDDLLSFFPAKTVAPIPRVRGRGRRGRGRGGGRLTQSMREPKSARAKKDNDSGKASTAKVKSGTPFNRPSMSGSGPPKVRRARTGGGPPRKRKILVQLPPPWHDKDPKRLSQSQQDDLLFNQKNILDWVKKDLIPQLLRECSPMLGERDELRAKNERYQERLVSKAFICPVPRGMKSLGLKTPKSIIFIEGFLMVIASSVGSALVEPKSLTSDNIVFLDMFDVDSPLFDVAIHPTSGQIVGIDSHWTLRLFEHGRTILSYPLNPEITLPKANKFLNFDKFGLLWVNLFPQKGPLLLMDPITLQPSLQINLDNVAQVHRYIRTVSSLTPLYFNDKPFGFAGVFTSLPEVYIFSYDFQKAKKLSHPRMKGFPIVKQANQRVFIWSSDAIIYVYELKEYMEGITQVTSIKMKSPPTDIVATVDPDMIYISCEDYTIHVLLGRTTEHPLRLANNRMERDELKFCDILLGPVTYTKSRNAFKEMAVHKFTTMPTKIAVYAFSEKMTIVSAIFETGNLCSVWMVNDSQNVKCIDFDKYNYSSPQMSQTLASNYFNENAQLYIKKREEYLETIEFFDKFDIRANHGLMNNMFNPHSQKFNLVKFFYTTDAHYLYPFLPDVDIPMRYISAYEVYQFLTRTHLLPAKNASFAGFLERYAPPEVQRPLPSVDLVMNPKLPVRTRSHYNSIVDIKYDAKQITEIINELDPLYCLNGQLEKFTITDTFIPDDSKVSRQRVWLSKLERKSLNRRLSYLSMLEDLVKHELMSRVQGEIDEMFNKNQLSKIQPITPIDIHQHAPRNDAKSIAFSKQPNRNPLLDEKRHKSIYDSWSKYVLFGKDESLQMNVRALHISSHLFNAKSVAAHFDLVRRASNASKKVSSIVHSFADKIGENVEIVVFTEDSRALPLSHYLTIHSFLGGTSKLISAVRSIFSRVLVALYQLHKSGIILRTLYPDNILLNASNLSVTFGSVYDCQLLPVNGRSIYLPLPKTFSHFSNPFLPPEFFHDPPRKYTAAFDIWQFGMSLLYVITGFLPESYGSELMKHLDDDWRVPKEHRVTIDTSNPLDDPTVYKRPIFFYDWMKGGPLVSEKERSTGERGECFFTTPAQGQGVAPPTILDLNNYKLLPCKNTKATYDETRLFIEIIASCLQIEPEKRPTVEQLLKTYPFSQTSQINDILDTYMRTPDPNVFVAQFYSPVLKNLSEVSFPFAIGIISALLFFEDPIEEDAPYAFPLDAKATEKVITSLFELKFIDQLVAFVLRNIEKTITINDVNPTVTYENECFDALHKFFSRFVKSVEKGTGPLVTHVDEVIMALLSLYAGSPHLRHSSLALKAGGNEMAEHITRDNAALYVFTHTKLHGLVKYSIDASPFIVKSLKRSPEHNDSYFDSFLPFSNAVYSFAHSLCFTVETQRANAIKTMASLFQNGQSLSVVRMFLDFRVFQKVIHCFYMPSARNDACSFICSSFRSIRMKSYDATYYMLQSALNVPTILLYCATGIKVGGNESLKLPSIEIIRNVLFGDSIPAISNLVYSDILFTLADNAKDTIFHNLIKDALGYASVFVQEIIISSPVMHKTMELVGIEYKPECDIKSLSESTNDINEVLMLAKKLTAVLFTRQTAMATVTEYPLDTACDYLIQMIQTTLKECDTVARLLDTQAYKPRAADAPPISLRSKGKAKEQSFQASQDTINEMCEVIGLMFNALCYFWRKNEHTPPKNLFDFLKDLILRELPYCRTMPHPANHIHNTIRLMFLFIFQHLSVENKIYSNIEDFSDIWSRIMHHDIIFVIQSADKETALLQLFGKYPLDRRIRERMFNSIHKMKMNILPIIKTIISEMLWSKTEVKFELTCNLSHIYRFPLRSEGINFVIKILQNKDRFEEAARIVAHELMIFNFLEREKHLTELDDNNFIVNTSIALLRAVMKCPSLFGIPILKETKVQLDSLEIRFSREIKSKEIFNKDKNKVKSIVTSPTVKETWQKPLTMLPKRNNPYGTVKTARSARPATAFASTRKRIIPGVTLTPR
ncbi:IQ calmodulin-binding motif family protein [Tritrichomonas foetus]|uniref:non-specific serine/threonine protein kinase n=1 Tax=Tritrichomonas foetus TaxID=1144522 RepID=A0A1J4JH61_9EUKA|nr:IQ calmodulin-binding motif family protein [Tritrichomonas foetus]|eukprot:OHS98482.1 IQ calmodulin-binding motif family protein [Tritrichomonas foetus]